MNSFMLILDVRAEIFPPFREEGADGFVAVDLALMDDEDPIGAAEDLVDVVAGKQHGFPVGLESGDYFFN